MTLARIDVAEIAEQAAEAALSHYVHRCGGHAALGWDESTFDGCLDSLAEAIRVRLSVIDSLVHHRLIVIAT